MTGYIAYDPYRAGVNNVRLNFELVAALAHVTGRTLAIPERKMSMEREHFGRDGVYVPYHPAAFLDISGVDWVPENSLPPGLITHEVPPIPNRDSAVLCLEDGPDRDAFLAGRQAVWLDGNIAEADVIRLPEIIVPFYAAIYANEDDRRRMARFVREHVRHQQRAFNVAWQCWRGLDPFHAAVVRRADFLSQYGQADVAAEAIAQTLAEAVSDGALLLIATDETNRDWFAPLSQRWRLAFARDEVRRVAPALAPPLLGCAEQNLCSFGETFTGTFLSSFSAYVDRLRFYDRYRERPRFTDGSHNHIDDNEGSPLFSWQPFMRHSTAIWGREFREGGEWAED